MSNSTIETNDVGEMLPRDMQTAGEIAGAIWSERDGAEAVRIVRARDAEWLKALRAAVLAARASERETCIGDCEHELRAYASGSRERVAIDGAIARIRRLGSDA